MLYKKIHSALFGASDDEMINMSSIKPGKENNKKISSCGLILYYSDINKNNQ